jgi:succinoglycan biosynthesis protein ExoV
MRVVYYESLIGNFGDDLNALLWRELLPPECFEDDDAILLGIGSIFREDYLSARSTRGKRVFVLGSGAGTGPLPDLWPNDDWRILAVRGPLSARLLDRPGLDVTDGAALLSIATDLMPPVELGGEVVFFPHFNSIANSRWPEVCRLANMTFVDSRLPPREILAILGRARLVVTEAMHGAIVADTLRIPWVPVVCSPSIVPFKWVDWTRSMELDYAPLSLPASSGFEIAKHLKIRVAERRELHRGMVEAGDDDLIEDFHRRYDGVAVDRLSPGKPVRSGIRTAVERAVAPLDRIAMQRAAQALRRAARSRSYLSRDTVLANRVTRLQEGVETLRRELMG